MRPRLVERELAVDDLVTRLRVEQKAFGARRRPLDRAADAARCPKHQYVVGVDVGLHAEAAADVGRNHMDFGLRYIEDGFRQHAAHAMRTLRRRIERVLAVGGAEEPITHAARSGWP